MTELHLDSPCPGGDLKEPRTEEATARDIFGPYIEGELFAYDDPPDFVLCRGSRVAGWAEVTTAVDGVSQAFRDRLKKDGQSFESGGLSSSWVVSFEKDAKLKDLDRDALAASLRSAEESKDDTTLEKELVTFGVAHAIPVRPGTGPATVYLDLRSFGSSVAPELANELSLEKAVAKKESLQGRDGERHLFVLVNYDWPGGAGLALSDPEPPVEPPHLPDWVTDIWMASVKSLVWHASAETEGWDVIARS